MKTHQIQTEEKSELKYYEKGIVRCWTKNDLYDDGYVFEKYYKKISNWSNLLDSALENKDEHLARLVSGIKIDELKMAFSTLDETLKISIEHQNPKEVDVTPFSFRPAYYVASIYNKYVTSEVMAPDKIEQARINLLCCLNNTHIQKMGISKADKRLIEKGYKKIIYDAQTLTELLILYEKFNRSGILEHQRNPRTSKMLSSIFKPRYSKLKESILISLQEQAFKLLSPDVSEKISNQLAQTIFSPLHAEFGIKMNKASDKISSPFNKKKEMEMGLTKRTIAAHPMAST